MKYFVLSPFAVLLSALLVSCSGGNNQSSELGSVIEKASKSDEEASGDNKCLLDYADKIDELLTEAEVLDATGFNSEKLEKDVKKREGRPSGNEVSYKFQNKRMGQIPTVKGTFELPDVVRGSKIKAISLKHFRNNYRTVTAEEMAAAKQRLNEVVDGKGQSEEAKKAADALEKSNVSKDEAKKAGGGMISVFQQVSEGYRNVDNLGDAAVWNVVTNDLSVLQTGVEFTLMVEISNDNDKNKEVAINLAKKVLAKCK